MPKVTTVQHARKDYPAQGIAKGDTYYWWEFRFGGIHRSKSYPKPSQLTQSEFLSTVYSISEGFEGVSADEFIRNDEDGNLVIEHEDLQSRIEDLVSELESLRDETQEKFDNMPEGLQQGETGQKLEGRVSSVDEMLDSLNSIDLGELENFNENHEGEFADDPEGRKQAAIDVVQAAIDEIQSALNYSGE